MAFCTSCGASLTQGAKFCEACGAPIEEVPVAQPAPEPIPVAQPAAAPVPVAQPAAAPVPVAQPRDYAQQGYAQQSPQAPVQAPAHGMAVASLVLGIVGLLCCGICSAIALGLSISAKKQGNAEGIRTAGFVLGCIGVVLWVIGIIYTAASGSF